MENTDLIKIQDELETIFKINILHSVDKAESLYKRFSDILSKKDELLAFIKSKRYEYRSVIKDSVLYKCFLDYISAIAKIHNIPISSDIYDLIEYIGYNSFKSIIEWVKPQYVSCVIQVDSDKSFVSESKYIHKFDSLESIHNNINSEELTKVLNNIGYKKVVENKNNLPNKKILLQLDYAKM